MTIVDSFIIKAQKTPARIVYPEGTDLRVLTAARKAHALGIAHPTLIGDHNTISTIADNNNISLDGLEIVNSRNSSSLETYASAYSHNRELRESVALKLVKKPLSFGGMMVREGHADGMVAGVATATSLVIQSASLTVGLQAGLSTPSSFFIMVIPEFLGKKNTVFIFADSAVNVQPTARQLADIAVASGKNAQTLLGIEPRIAFLSFSTKGSASHADAEKVIEALSLAREMAPEISMDGELQLDAAIIPSVAEKKAENSGVAGKANVLIFPDLDAGNIGYKLVQRMANAIAIGPILQGFARPVNDMSRGATVDDLVAVTAITSVQAMG